MSDTENQAAAPKMTSVFEKYLTVWVGLCIVGGILLGKVAPSLAQTLDGMAIYVGGAPVVSIPIAIATFFLGYVFRGMIPGVEIVKDGTEVELFRSYVSGAILLGIASISKSSIFEPATFCSDDESAACGAWAFTAASALSMPRDRSETKRITIDVPNWCVISVPLPYQAIRGRHACFFFSV